MKHFNIPIFIPHLGCPFQCIFCNQNRITAQNTMPEPEDVTRLVNRWLKTLPEKGANIEIAFFGGSFTALDQGTQEKYLKAALPYVENNRVTGIRISTRPDCIDGEILGNLQRFKVKTIELGVQSYCDEVLKASGRGYTEQDVIRACRQVVAHGFKLGIQLMIGLPADSLARDMYSTNQAISAQPDMVRLYPTLVIKDTPLETLYLQGKYNPCSLAEAVFICKEMYLEFERKGINVIRMGLHPGEELNAAGAVVAGPYHPSFGELVEQDIFKEQADLAVSQLTQQLDAKPRDITLFVHKKDISKLTGHRKSNLDYFYKTLGLNKIDIKTSPTGERNWVGANLKGMKNPLVRISRQELAEKRRKLWDI
ncbi:MAG: elongator complex protein 3 [Syntrophomonadaceae bacterium]|jgi:histone acetyltransferase (RNA polymerase elongator complex component)